MLKCCKWISIRSLFPLGMERNLKKPVRDLSPADKSREPFFGKHEGCDVYPRVSSEEREKFNLFSFRPKFRQLEEFTIAIVK